ncbi:hypothetical protein Tco_0818407 [Tanacetum coccineum]
MWRSIEKGPYVRPMILDPDNTGQQIIEPLSKMTEINKKQYTADVRVMNYLLQAIPNVILSKIRKIRRIRACTHQIPQRKQVQYAISSEDQYAVLEI